MSQAGHPPPLFGHVSAPRSTTSSTGDLSDATCFLSFLIDHTCDRIQLDSPQFPSLSARDCNSLFSGEALILLFLLPTVYTISTLEDRLEEPFSSFHLLQSPLGNSVACAELRDLLGAVPDLSYRLPHSLPCANLASPLPPLSSPIQGKLLPAPPPSRAPVRPSPPCQPSVPTLPPRPR